MSIRIFFYLIFVIVLGFIYSKVQNAFLERRLYRLEQLSDKDIVHSYIFDYLSLFFLLMFVYFSFIKNIEYGFSTMIFIWAFLVCSVPIPQVGLLLTFPLKHLLGISMDISQFLVSIIAALTLGIYHLYLKRFIKFNTLGKIFHNIINKRLYSIFILSILSSISLSYLIDMVLDINLYTIERNQKYQNLFQKLYNNIPLHLIIVLFCNFLYIHKVFYERIFI